MKTSGTVLAVLAVCSIGVANAGNVNGLTTFTSGSKAVATEVNGNFDAVKTAVDDNNSRTTANTADIATNTTGIATNTTDIATLQAATGPERVAYVSPSGGDYADPVAAMADLATWCGTPSATNMCLLKIMPGIYNLGTTQLQMQSFVDIEGSGEKVTYVTGTVSGFPGGVVVGASDTELRDLTVEHTGAPGTTSGAINSPSPNERFSLRRITARAFGSKHSIALVTNSSSLTVTDLTAVTSGTGFQNSSIYIYGGTSHTFSRITTSASGATSNNIGLLNSNSSTTTVLHSVINGASRGIFNSAPALTLQHSTVESTTGFAIEDNGGVTVSHSQLSGGVSGTVNVCAFVVDESFVPLGANCL